MIRPLLLLVLLTGSLSAPSSLEAKTGAPAMFAPPIEESTTVEDSAPEIAQLLAGQDVLFLDNGERLVGDLKRLQHGKLRFKADQYDTISVKWRRITAISSADEYEVELLGGQVIFGSLAPTAEAGQLMVLGEGGAEIVALDQVSRIQPIESTTWSRIDGSASLGLNIATASDLYQSSAHFDSTYTTRRFRTSLTYDGLVNDANDEASRAFRHDAVLSSQRTLPGRWDWLTSAVLRSNEDLGLDLRASLEGLAVYNLLSRSQRQINLGSGLAVGREWADSGPSEGSLEAVLGVYGRTYVFGDLETDSTWDLRFYPSLTTSGRYRTELTAKVRRELVADLFLSLNLNYSYDSDPLAGQDGGGPPDDDGVPPQIEKQDLALTLSFGYSW